MLCSEKKDLYNQGIRIYSSICHLSPASMYRVNLYATKEFHYFNFLWTIKPTLPILWVSERTHFRKLKYLVQWHLIPLHRCTHTDTYTVSECPFHHNDGDSYCFNASGLYTLPHSYHLSRWGAVSSRCWLLSCPLVLFCVGLHNLNTIPAFSLLSTKYPITSDIL